MTSTPVLSFPGSSGVHPAAHASPAHIHRKSSGDFGIHCWSLRRAFASIEPFRHKSTVTHTFTWAGFPLVPFGTHGYATNSPWGQVAPLPALRAHLPGSSRHGRRGSPAMSAPPLPSPSPRGASPRLRLSFSRSRSLSLGVRLSLRTWQNRAFSG
jgi:hypothetical protein